MVLRGAISMELRRAIFVSKMASRRAARTRSIGDRHQRAGRLHLQLGHGARRHGDRRSRFGAGHARGAGNGSRRGCARVHTRNGPPAPRRSPTQRRGLRGGSRRSGDTRCHPHFGWSTDSRLTRYLPTLVGESTSARLPPDPRHRRGGTYIPSVVAPQSWSGCLDRHRPASVVRCAPQSRKRILVVACRHAVQSAGPQFRTEGGRGLAADCGAVHGHIAHFDPDCDRLQSNGTREMPT